MIFNTTKISGLCTVTRDPVKDDRGEFFRIFDSKISSNAGFKESIVQSNLSRNNNTGTIRGMHYQHSGFEEDKLVTCTQGKKFDVAIDIRKNSPTFLEWFGVVLDANEYTSMFVPRGFAHGYQTLCDNCEIVYLHTNFYNRDFESSINPFDPMVSIKWPLGCSEVSAKDKSAIMIDKKFYGIEINEV